MSALPNQALFRPLRGAYFGWRDYASDVDNAERFCAVMRRR